MPDEAPTPSRDDDPEASEEFDFVTEFDEAEETPVTAVIRAIATIEGVEPDDLETPLSAYVDPEALNRLLGMRQHDGVVVHFRAWGREIAVEGDGTVRVA